ncbi:MAG TPA: hypothetical protein VF142_24245 [Longimicrobium sp.]
MVVLLSAPRGRISAARLAARLAARRDQAGEAYGIIIRPAPPAEGERPARPRRTAGGEA